MNWVLKGRNIFTADGRIVAQVHYPHVVGDLSGVTEEEKLEMGRNALVLTAAPELLAALRELVAQIERPPHLAMADDVEAARAAIAKAEGK